MQMPHMDGIEVLRRIAAEGWHQNMTIVVLTANPHMITEDVEAYVDYRMLKPVDYNQFLQFINRL
jgi:CheY-like chemotaxis protein